jgi:hypothetical protein
MFLFRAYQARARTSLMGLPSQDSRPLSNACGIVPAKKKKKKKKTKYNSHPPHECHIQAKTAPAAANAEGNRAPIPFSALGIRRHGKFFSQTGFAKKKERLASREKKRAWDSRRRPSRFLPPQRQLPFSNNSHINGCAKIKTHFFPELFPP